MKAEMFERKMAVPPPGGSSLAVSQSPPGSGLSSSLNLFDSGEESLLKVNNYSNNKHSISPSSRNNEIMFPPPKKGRLMMTSSANLNNAEQDLSSTPSLVTPTAMSTPPNELWGETAAALQNSLTFISPPASMDDPFSPNNEIGREDLSPGGGFSADSCGEGKKKKGPVPRQQEELCLVCGDRASGYHYNALTCEGCKGFFRRSITKNAVYQCKYGNNCEIDMYMRRKCQECRLKKCLHVGMRPECVVPEYQCAVKREQKKQQKEKDKPNSTTQSPTPKADLDIKDERVSSMELSSNTNGLGGKNGVSPLKPIAGKKLSQEQEELINRLVFFQDEFEQPNDDDLKRLTGLPSEGVDASEAKFRHITEMTILTVQLIVEFSKRLPGFDKLEREDQITLLKACSSEVMMLRTARRYDYNSDTIIFANNHPYTRDNYSIAGVGDSAEPLFNFCRHLCSMKVDNAEYALLTAIVIFSERPCLLEPRKVEKIQEIYLEALRAYVEYLHPVRPGYVPGVNFAKLLGVLTELRTLGNINSEMCFSLKLKNKKLPPFLAEIWDIAA